MRLGSGTARKGALLPGRRPVLINWPLPLACGPRSRDQAWAHTGVCWTSSSFLFKLQGGLHPPSEAARQAIFIRRKATVEAVVNRQYGALVTRFCGGNVPLSILMSLISNILALGLMPLMLYLLYEKRFGDGAPEVPYHSNGHSNIYIYMYMYMYMYIQNIIVYFILLLSHGVAKGPWSYFRSRCDAD